jgi:hypothetical protein
LANKHKPEKGGIIYEENAYNDIEHKKQNKKRR